MSNQPTVSAVSADLDAIASAEGLLVIFVPEAGTLDRLAKRVNRLTRGAVERFVASADFTKMKEGDVKLLSYPSGVQASGVVVARLERRTQGDMARKAGAGVGRLAGDKSVTVLAGALRGASDVVLGALLRAYSFDAHKTSSDEEQPETSVSYTCMVTQPDDLQPALAEAAALADAVHFTRDLVNEPSNVLTTTEFANRLEDLASLGLKVEVLEEDELEKLGMRTLLAVGMGSECPSKVVVMHWNGGGDEAPFALVGKGVCFDTGGISLKPAAGMEGMTMDMGGAGTVAGAMRALALRKATANVVGLVGLVENMPDGRAQRPGDVVRSMKGDTVEVINTDAEGRLVLCDVLWYA